MSEQGSQFDVGGQQLASVYAKAFVGAVSAESGDVETLVDEFESLVRDGIGAQPAFQELLANQLVSPSEKVAILDRVFSGKASALVLHFLKVVAEHERLVYLPAMSAQIRELFDESQNRHRVEVTTAAPLDDESREGLTAKIRQQLGCEPKLDEKVDPSLIGGVVIRVGDRVFDGSVTDRIRRMRADLGARYAEAIETRRDELVAEFTEN